MLGEPLCRISRADLDKLMGTMEVVSAQLSECLFADGARLHIEGGCLPTIHYGLTGTGLMFIEGEAAFELAPHMLVVAPASKSVDIVASSSFRRSRSGGECIKKNIFVPGSVHRYEIGEGEASFSLVSGRFHGVYAAGLDIFASLASAIVENFDAYHQIDRLIPTSVNQNRCAQSRIPIDMIFHGCASSLFHASQQWETMSS